MQPSLAAGPGLAIGRPPYFEPEGIKGRHNVIADEFEKGRRTRFGTVTRIAR